MVKKFTIFLTFATVVCLLYVYQHTEILKLAYAAQKKTVFCENLVDKNTCLKYHNQRIISLVNVGDKIMASKEFEFPYPGQLVKLDVPEASTDRSSAKIGQKVFALLNLHLKTAEAQTVGR